MRRAPVRRRPGGLGPRARGRALSRDVRAVRRRPPAVARASEGARGERPHPHDPTEEDLMQLNAYVELELAPAQQPDELSTLLVVTAPETREAEPRPPAAVQV